MWARNVNTKLSISIFLVVLMILTSCSREDIEIKSIGDTNFADAMKLTITYTPTNTEIPKIYPTITYQPTISPIIKEEITSTPELPSPTTTQDQDDIPKIFTIIGKVDESNGNGILSISPNDQLIALARNDVKIFNLESHVLLFDFSTPHNCGYAANLAFNADARFVAVIFICGASYSESKLMVWELENGDLIFDRSLSPATMEGEDGGYIIPVYGLAFSPNLNNNLLAYSNGKTVEIKDIDEDDEPLLLKLGNIMYATQISFSEDGKYLIILMKWDKYLTFPTNYSFKFKVQVWDTFSSLLRRDVDYPEVGYFEEDMSLNGPFLNHFNEITGVFTSTNMIDEVVSYFPFRKGLSFVSPDGSLIAFVRPKGCCERGGVADSTEARIEVWKTDTWRNIYEFKPDFLDIPFAIREQSLAFSSDNSLIAIAQQGQIFIWEIRSILN